MKLPEKYTEVFKTYKNGTPEEKAKIEDYFIKGVNDEDSGFYSPMMANLNEHSIKDYVKTSV
ncbi:phage protein [Staphylococcus aureus]|nr:phage protein [Staphylococcus aureus]